MVVFIRILILALIFSVTVLLLLASNKIEQALPGYRPMWAAVLGVLFGFALYAAVNRILKARVGSTAIEIFRPNACLNGVGFALLAFNFSLAAFSFTNKIDYVGFDFRHLVSQLFFQTNPALIEEIGFRYGLGLFAYTYFGLSAGVIAGAIPLGLLQLIGFATGEPIIWSYFLGTIVAGAFLTLIFFRHGLLAAILCHFTWNVLSFVSARTFSFSQEALEGSPTTIIILAFFTIRLWQQLRKFTA